LVSVACACVGTYSSAVVAVYGNVVMFGVVTVGCVGRAVVVSVVGVSVRCDNMYIVAVGGVGVAGDGVGVVRVVDIHGVFCCVRRGLCVCWCYCRCRVCRRLCLLCWYAMLLLFSLSLP